MSELPIRRLQAKAVLPLRAYPGDAGLDLASRERVEIGPGERAVVGTGLAVAIPDGHAGLVDSGYRGEVQVVLVNTDRTEAFTVEPGMRIAQLVVVPVAVAEPVDVDTLPETERGVAGFGSSGT